MLATKKIWNKYLENLKFVVPTINQQNYQTRVNSVSDFFFQLGSKTFINNLKNTKVNKNK